MEYLKFSSEQSSATKLIWEGYKRNHKGAIPPMVSIFAECGTYSTSYETGMAQKLRLNTEMGLRL